jgi:hypothetical protein
MKWLQHKNPFSAFSFHLDSCRIRYRTSRTISYVQTYDIVRTVLDVVCYIVYTISYIRYSVTGPTILDLLVRYRMFIRYRMSTYDIVGQTYDIVSLHENISYTISYVQKYVRCRTSITYDIVRTHRIWYRMSITISYVYLWYRMLTYDIVSQLGHRMLDTISLLEWWNIFSIFSMTLRHEK